jgi:hypothetical protein
MRRAFRIACIVGIGVASSACGPGPGKLAIVTQPGANNVHLVIENGGPNAARLLINLNERILFDERVEPSVEMPAIVADRWTTLPSRSYRVDVLDRLSGRTATTTFRMGSYVRIHVTVFPGSIGIHTTDDPREGYE